MKLPTPALARSLLAQHSSWSSSKSQPHTGEETKLARGGGKNGPRNCLKIVPLLEEALATLRRRRPSGFGGAVLNCAGPNNSVWQGLRLLRSETLKHSINTYGIKRFNHNIAQFLQLLL